MSKNISICAVAALILLSALFVDAQGIGGSQQPINPPVTQPGGSSASQRKTTVKPTDDSKNEPPAFKMTCPDANEVSLNISYTMGGWILTPSQLRTNGFTRAYATVDAANKTRVILACLYQVTTDYMATTQYNGLQKCICSESTGEGKVGYTGPAGYTMNVAGTSAHGKLPVRKTGQQVKDQKLECQFHADGQAQFFKKFQAPGQLSTCQANGREVSCPY
jgi:uncharacterized protein YdeI (BOF family)